MICDPVPVTGHPTVAYVGLAVVTDREDVGFRAMPFDDTRKELGYDLQKAPDLIRQAMNELPASSRSVVEWDASRRGIGIEI